MPLSGTKDDHFSCFHSSCQLGLKMSITFDEVANLKSRGIANVVRHFE